jgi:hypothetical protein
MSRRCSPSEVRAVVRGVRPASPPERSPLMEWCIPTASWSVGGAVGDWLPHVAVAVPSRVRTIRAPRPGQHARQLPGPTAPPRSGRAVGTIRSWVSLSYRVFPSDRRRVARTVTPCASPRLPLLGFRSLQRSPVQRVRFSRGFQLPAPCVLGVRSSLDALLPFTPPGHLCPGRSWDCDLQGLAPPEDPRGSFEPGWPSWHCSTRRPHASNDVRRTRPSRGS